MRRSFSADLSKFGVTVDKRMTSLIREVAVDTLDDLHGINPVFTGWSRGSWLMTVNKPGSGVYSYYSGVWVRGNQPKGNRPRPPAVMGIPRQPSALPILRWSDKVYFTNNVPYFKFVEEKHQFLEGVLGRAKNKLYKIARRLAK